MYALLVDFQALRCVIAAGAWLACCGINQVTNVRSFVQMHDLDVILQCLMFPEHLIAWRELYAAIFLLLVVSLQMSPQSRPGAEFLIASRPITDILSLLGVGARDVALQMAVAQESLAAVRFLANERALVGVRALVFGKTNWA